MNATSRRLGAVRAASFHRVRNSIATSLLSMMMVSWSVLHVGAQDVRLVLNPYDGIDWQSVTHHKANRTRLAASICRGIFTISAAIPGRVRRCWTAIWTMCVCGRAGSSSHALRFRARDEAQQVPCAAVEQYLDLYRHHQRLIGVEVLNGTRPLREYWLDRQLWDKLLTELMPDRPVWGLATDDMHSMTHLGRDWVVFPAGDLDEPTVRQAMLDGTFYFCTTRHHAPEQASVEGTPRITSVVHDPNAGTITVQATVQGQPVAAEAFQWISAGQVVQTGPQLNYRQSDGVDNYARLEIQGSGGTTYTNPFGFSTD